MKQYINYEWGTRLYNREEVLSPLLHNPYQQAQCLQTSTIFHHLQHQKIINLMASTTSAVHYHAASNTIPSPTTLHMITITISNTK